MGIAPSASVKPNSPIDVIIVLKPGYKTKKDECTKMVQKLLFRVNQSLDNPSIFTIPYRQVPDGQF